MKKIIIFLALALLYCTAMAQTLRKQFAYEQREGDTLSVEAQWAKPGRPRPDLRPNIAGTQRAVSNDQSLKTSKDVVGWVPNGICLCDTAPSGLPKIVSDGNSGAIICWTECYRDQVSLDDDIYAQRVDSGGNFVWQSQGVPVCSLKGSYSNYPAMISDGQGGAIIAWEDSRGGLGYTRVFAQRLDSLGNRVWPENGVLVCNQMSGYVDICSDGHGGAIIAYVDGRDPATSDNIYAQRIDSSGNLVWQIDGVPVCTADSIQFWPHMCATQNNGTVITWEDDYRNNGTTGRDVYAQLVDSSGSAKWILNGEPICVKIGMQRLAKLCENNFGGAIIKWNDRTDSITYAQSLDSIGNMQWGSNGINLNAGYSGYIKSILFGGGVSNVYNAQYIDYLGNIKWGDGVLLHGDTTGGQFGSSSDQLGNLFVLWDELRNSTFYSDQYVQKVDTNGNILWGLKGTAVCTLKMEYETYPQITGDGVGGAIATWYGSPINGDNHIWAQRVYSNGIPGGVSGTNISIYEPIDINFNVYPNPAVNSAKINFTIAQSGCADLSIYNIIGQKVSNIYKGYLAQGKHTYQINLLNRQNNKLSNGVYFCVLKINGNTFHKKLTILK